MASSAALLPFCFYVNAPECQQPNNLGSSHLDAAPALQLPLPSQHLQLFF